MSPELAKKLMSDVPEMQDFVAFVQQEANKLNNLADISLTSPVDLAVEVKARQKAYEVLIGVLNPLLDSTEVRSKELLAEIY